MTLNEYLKEYRSLTLDIIENINTTGNIKRLVEEREYILNKITSLNFDEMEVKRIILKLNIVELEKEMNLALKTEKANIKRKLQNLKRMHQGNNHYISLGYVESRFNKFI